MSWFEGMLVSVVMKILERLASFLSSRASRWKEFNDDSKEGEEEAKKINESAKKIREHLEAGKEITKEMADELKKRNRRLRSGLF